MSNKSKKVSQILIFKSRHPIIQFTQQYVSGGHNTSKLMYVRVPAITNDECKSAYSKSDYDDILITDSMICDGYPDEKGKGACVGDSGGPFVCNDEGKAVAVGVISWGIGCAIYPGVNSRNAYVLNWIKTNMVITNIAQSMILISKHVTLFCNRAHVLDQIENMFLTRNSILFIFVKIYKSLKFFMGNQFLLS